MLVRVVVDVRRLERLIGDRCRRALELPPSRRADLLERHARLLQRLCRRRFLIADRGEEPELVALRSGRRTCPS